MLIFNLNLKKRQYVKRNFPKYDRSALSTPLPVNGIVPKLLEPDCWVARSVFIYTGVACLPPSTLPAVIVGATLVAAG